MAVYPFYCQKCDEEFESVESIKTYDGDGECPTCQTVSRERVFKAGGIYFLGTSVESAEYNPALGQVVKNSKHRNEIAKQKGLIEIGNEKPEAIHKHYDNQRADKLKKSWDDV